MKIGVIGALTSEVELFCERLENKKTHTLKYMTVYEGKIGNNDVAICCSSIGKVNAAIAVQILIDKFGAQAIINSGIAGAIGDGVNILDVVVSDVLTYHDADMDIFVKYPPFGCEYSADTHLVNMAVKACKKVMDKERKLHIGKIVTGDRFICQSEVKEEIKKRCNPLCLEMEGAAVAQTSVVNEVPFVVIRTMSDSANDGGSMDYDKFEKIAAKSSAEIVYELIKSL